MVHDVGRRFHRFRKREQLLEENRADPADGGPALGRGDPEPQQRVPEDRRRPPCEDRTRDRASVAIPGGPLAQYQENRGRHPRLAARTDFRTSNPHIEFSADQVGLGNFHLNLCGPTIDCRNRAA